MFAPGPLCRFGKGGSLKAIVEQKELPMSALPAPLAAQADKCETCCICLDRLSKGEPRMLRCSHVLHRDCLRRMLWNKSEVVCPLCKTPS